jgi:hypothetical protein
MTLPGDDASLIGKLENLEGRATRDFFASDYGQPRAGDRGSPDSTCRGERIIPSSAKLEAFDMLNAETSTVPERKLFALVDAVACVLAHGGRYGSEETARLALESVAGSAVALAAVRTLVERQGR